jgi:hypothetical protein
LQQHTHTPRFGRGKKNWAWRGGEQEGGNFYDYVYYVGMYCTCTWNEYHCVCKGTGERLSRLQKNTLKTKH